MNSNGLRFKGLQHLADGHIHQARRSNLHNRVPEGIVDGDGHIAALACGSDCPQRGDVAEGRIA